MPPALELTDSEQCALDADWLAVCRHARDRVGAVVAGYVDTAARSEKTGRGAGGDMALVIDRAAEDEVIDELRQLAATGAGFTVVSEEVGEVVMGGVGVRVVVDPIDGSLNAKRMIPSFSLSIGVAAGDTMADMRFGFVHDFGTGEEWHATLGGGAFLNDELLDRTLVGNGLEVVGWEAAKPANISPGLLAHYDGRVHRLRVVGSIALSLCQVAAARFDGMCSLRGCRSVDAAAGQLIVREAGGHVAFGNSSEPLAAPLDLIAHQPVAAARTEEGLAFLQQGLLL